MKFDYNGKLYVVHQGINVLGPGRVELLERIGASASIRQAAKEMKMSYRQAWQHIDDMNTHFGMPVVLTERGGRGGGRSTLTATGTAVITAFKDFHRQFQHFLSQNTFSISS